MRKFNFAGLGRTTLGVTKSNLVTGALANMMWDVSSVENVSEDAGYLTYLVSRSGDSSSAASINIATSNGTATAGLDYVALNQKLNFAAGESSKLVKVAIINDKLAEANETVNLHIRNPSKGIVNHAKATAVINDNDRVVGETKWSVVSKGVAEENEGFITYEVSREGNLNQAASIKVATGNGTAKAGSDYVALNQIVKFDSGEASKIIKVAIMDDRQTESNETVDLIISRPSKGQVGVGKATAIVHDNDQNQAPVITSGDTATIAENTVGVAYQVQASDADGDRITYSLSGVDADWINIDANTGEVSFRNPPDYEAHHVPNDGMFHTLEYPHINPVYNINVIASDGQLSTEKAVTVHVADVFDAKQLQYSIGDLPQPLDNILYG